MAGSWFSSSNSAFENMVERATSSSLEDIMLNLEISDTIRSKAVQPRDAMRILKKRIDHMNPNVQLAALNLTDTCVKNGGSHFLMEIDSREFMDNLTSILRASGPVAVNNDVKQKTLELIQTWAIASEGKGNLSYIKHVYTSLSKDGFDFPPKPHVASTILDSSAPPDWVDSDVCMRCRTPFTFTNRKHHCRNCGCAYCGACSSKTLALPHLGISLAVRVDDGCYTRLTERSRGSLAQPKVEPSKPSSTLYQGSMQPREARVGSSFESELTRALEMSLEESRMATPPPRANMSGKSMPVISSSSKPSNTVAPSSQARNTTAECDEDDPDLRIAIAASLAEAEASRSRQSRESRTQRQPSSNHPAAYTESRATPTPASVSTELTPAEAENINLFAILVERLRHQPEGTILREPQIHELYENIGKLRTKLARTYGETISKHDALMDLHAKLCTVIRYYDRMLEERLSSCTFIPSNHGIDRNNLYQSYLSPMPDAPSTLQPTRHQQTPSDSALYNERLMNAQ